MANEPNNSILQTGTENGIKLVVDIEDGVYVIVMPNSYDLTHAFLNRHYTKVGTLNAPENPDRIKNIMFTVPSAEMDEARQKQVMADVRHARNTNQARLEERERIIDIVSFEHPDIQNKIVGIPLMAKRDADNNIMKSDSNKTLLTPSYVKGELVAVGQYFIAVKYSNPANADDSKLHMIETNRFLKLEDYKTHSRIDAVISKLHLDPATDIQSRSANGAEVGIELRPGIKRYIAFNENGSVKDISAKTYTNAKSNANKTALVA